MNDYSTLYLSLGMALAIFNAIRVLRFFFQGNAPEHKKTKAALTRQMDERMLPIKAGYALAVMAFILWMMACVLV